METPLPPCEPPFCLKLGGKMTYEFYRELEDNIFNAMRRYSNLEIDLSEVREIDLCGLHLVGLLQSVGVIVAASPVVEHASRRLLTALRASALNRATKGEHAAIACH